MAEQTCDNCGVGHGPDDVFCENCGYDFLTGSLPDDQAALVPDAAPKVPLDEVAAPDEAVSPGEETPIQIEVAVDRAYFDAVVTDGELDYPDPEPAPIVVPWQTDELHIGRSSASRGIHPDLDLAALTDDPAVSSRHAVITRAEDGALRVVDVGSTNGTTLAAPDAEPLEADAPVELDPGVPVYVGAWTRLTVLPG